MLLVVVLNLKKKDMPGDDAKNGKPLSDEIAEAKERAQAWTDSGLGGNVYGTGAGAKVAEVDYTVSKINLRLKLSISIEALVLSINDGKRQEKQRWYR